MKKAIVLLSGGLDSATTLHVALDRGYHCRCLIFDYDQRHKKEIKHAVKIAKAAGCDYEVIKLPFSWGIGNSKIISHRARLRCKLGDRDFPSSPKEPKQSSMKSVSWCGSALLDKKARLPKRSIKNIGKGIPPTYVPARNTVFLSIAASMAEATDAGAIFIGANAVDYSGYPDCRAGYFSIFEKLLKKGTKRGITGRDIKIITPLIGKTKAEIIKLGSRLKVPYHLTWSCYAGKKIPCMECDSCLLREKGFREAGIKDPLV